MTYFDLTCLPRNRAASNVRWRLHVLASIGALFVIVCLLPTGCAKTQVPSDRTAIFSPQDAPALLELCFVPLDGITGYWQPSARDLSGLEGRLEDYLRVLGNRRRLPRDVMPEWSRFYRQACGVIRNGERLLFISYGDHHYSLTDPRIAAERTAEAKQRGIRLEPDWWRRTPLFVADGGSQFFRVLYDLKKKQFVWYEDNG